MTREEAWRRAKGYLYDALSGEEADEIIKALEQDPIHGSTYGGVSWGGTYKPQEPCDDEYIIVPKKALKYRTAGMVAYNAEWLKNHFDMERAVICGVQEPITDRIEYGTDGNAYRLTISNGDEFKQETKMGKVIKMRDATPEEREAVDKYIKSISKTTGVNFWDLEQEPCDDAVSREVYKQVIRERDIAIEQLNELGYEFGEKIEEPKYCDRNICVSNEYKGIGCEDCEVTKGRRN